MKRIPGICITNCCWNLWFRNPSDSYECHLIVEDFNALAPWKFEQSFTKVILKLILVTDGWGISCKIALSWMPLDLADGKSTLVQAMAWCRQATLL